MDEKRFNEVAENWLGHLLDDICDEPFPSDEHNEWVDAKMSYYLDTFKDQFRHSINQVLGDSPCDRLK